MSILSLQAVDVQRGEFVLCQNINLQLKAGDICHLTGENGLGKSTLLHQIAGLLPTYSGNIHVADRVVYVSHHLGISKDLTVAQNLQFLLVLYGVVATREILDSALDAVELYGLADTPSAQLSAGQTRRIGLARLFVLTPQHASCWLLDEPLTALDMRMVSRIEQRMNHFATSGGAILATSHQPIKETNQYLDLTEFAL